MTHKLVQLVPSGESYAIREAEDGTIYMSRELMLDELENDLSTFECDNEATDFYNALEWNVLREA